MKPPTSITPPAQGMVKPYHALGFVVFVLHGRQLGREQGLAETEQDSCCYALGLVFPRFGNDIPTPWEQASHA